MLYIQLSHEFDECNKSSYNNVTIEILIVQI